MKEKRIKILAILAATAATLLSALVLGFIVFAFMAGGGLAAFTWTSLTGSRWQNKDFCCNMR